MGEVVSEKAAKVIDLLEQIEAVNKMVEIHEGDSFMQDQYLHRKEEFVKELIEQLKKYSIEKEDLAA